MLAPVADFLENATELLKLSQIEKPKKTLLNK